MTLPHLCTSILQKWYEVAIFWGGVAQKGLSGRQVYQVGRSVLAIGLRGQVLRVIGRLRLRHRLASLASFDGCFVFVSSVLRFKTENLPLALSPILPFKKLHPSLFPSSERRSQAFAISQSRFTVAGEISSTSAVSSMVRPPK